MLWLGLASLMDARSKQLASLVGDAAQSFKGDCNGGLIWVEHLNIVIGNRELAEQFYFEGLGLTRDPRKLGPTGTMWANLGSQQFHLAEEASDDPPQTIDGSVGLAVPDASAAATRLSRLGVHVQVHDAARFTTICPWGNVFHCYDVDAYRTGPPNDLAGGPKMVQVHQNYDADGRFTVRGGPGIRYVHLRCADAKAAADAYAAHFGTYSTVERDLAAVSAGLGPVHLVFETAELDHEAQAKMHGVHLCCYVDDMAKRYSALQDCSFTNPRFRHLDTCDTVQEALDSRTFRFAFPAVPELEHETRALSHRNFLQSLAYSKPAKGS